MGEYGRITLHGIFALILPRWKCHGIRSAIHHAFDLPSRCSHHSLRCLPKCAEQIVSVALNLCFDFRSGFEKAVVV